METGKLLFRFTEKIIKNKFHKIYLHLELYENTCTFEGEFIFENLGHGMQNLLKRTFREKGEFSFIFMH